MSNDEDVKWLGLVFDSLIVFGLVFFTNLAAMGITGELNWAAALIAGSVMGGMKTFLFLAKKRGITNGVEL